MRAEQWCEVLIRHSVYRTHRWIAALAIALSSACTNSEGPQIFDPARTQAHVAGEASDALDSRGRFRFPLSLTTPPGELAQVEAERAALDYLRTFGRFHEDRWEREHGQEIELSVLRLCDRAFYVRSLYEIPDAAPQEIVSPFGPRWIVGMCGPNGRPVLSLSFSSTVDGLRLSGETFGVAVTRAAFLSVGVPSYVQGTLPLSPEEATVRTAGFAGRRIISVPRLVRPPYPASDLLSHWVVALESNVSVQERDSREVRSTNELAIGFGTTLREYGVFVFDLVSGDSVARVRDGSGVEWSLRILEPRRVQLVERVGGAP
jgi:hypothetical protein